MTADDESTTPGDRPGDLALARTFRRVGRLGFWVQVVIGAVPILVSSVVLLVNRSAVLPGGRFSLIGLFAIGSVMILVFTVIWFRRYVRIGAALASEGASWTRRRLTRAVGIGLTASSIGIVFSTIVMLVEVIYLLVVFLEMPQGGVPVIQTTAEGGSFISALDMLSLLAMILVVAAEIVVLVLGLWLLYRVTVASPDPAESTTP